MLIFKEKILKFYSQFPLESCLNLLVSFIICFILFLAYFQLMRPIQPAQYENIIKLSVQAEYPETQHMAQTLLTHKEVKRVEYFRLIHAERYESRHTKSYPGININD